MSDVGFPWIKIDCINLPLKHHYIYLEHKSKCYQSQKYENSRSIDTMSLKASYIPNKNSITLCLTILLPLPDYNSMTLKRNLLLQLLSSLPEWSRINALDQQFQLGHYRQSCWICKISIYIELMKAERSSHITATLNASLSKRNVITILHIHSRLINLHKVTTMKWSCGSVNKNLRS